MQTPQIKLPFHPSTYSELDKESVTSKDYYYYYLVNELFNGVLPSGSGTA
jgi:hypothetical protein